MSEEITPPSPELQAALDSMGKVAKIWLAHPTPKPDSVMFPFISDERPDEVLLVNISISAEIVDKDVFDEATENKDGD